VIVFNGAPSFRINRVAVNRASNESASARSEKDP
jgi:hypothetical protein